MVTVMAFLLLGPKNWDRCRERFTILKRMILYVHPSVKKPPWPSSSPDQDVLLLATPLLLYRFDTIPSAASSSGTFLSFTTSFPYLQISDKGMKASGLFGLPEIRLLCVKHLQWKRKKDAIRENQKVL
jgi:hypothetical protein